MTDIAIAARGVGKCYRVFDNQRSRLLHALWPRHTGGTQEIWALRDINFEVRKGESVAIIGRNGGGKSTLLEILTGTLTPTTGEVRVAGRVSALLELGSGFNPAYSGRDNVVLNGLLLGLTRDDILSRFAEIEAFAEIGAAIDRPVKTYSSGMVMRLAFAVQVLCDPEVLIVDEALSVGDYFFQQKCFARLRKMRDEGLTLLFVSHDMGTVRDLCATALYLVRGQTAFWGPSKEAINAFLAEGAAALAVPSPEPAVADATRTLQADLAKAREEAIWRRAADSLPEGSAERLFAVVVRDLAGSPVTSVRMGETLIVEVHFHTFPGNTGHIALTFKNRFDQIVTSNSPYLLGVPGAKTDAAGYCVLQFEVQCIIEAGLYSFCVDFCELTAPNQGRVLDTTGWLGPVNIQWDYENERAPFLGMFGLPIKASFK